MGGYEITEMDPAAAGHIILHDPASELDKVAAEREMLRLHDQSGRRWTGFPRANRRERYCLHDQNPAPCPTLRLLAAAHRRHPDYRQEWTP